MSLSTNCLDGLRLHSNATSQQFCPVPSNRALFRLLTLESIINQNGLSSEKFVIADVSQEHDLGAGKLPNKRWIEIMCIRCAVIRYLHRIKTCVSMFALRPLPPTEYEFDAE